MSQSDYITYKRRQHQLNEYRNTPTKLPAVLDSGSYVSFKEYSLENTILSSNTNYDKLLPTNVPLVFGMLKTCASTAPNFELCSGTNLRGNRVPTQRSGRYTYIPTPPVGTLTKAEIMNWKPITRLTFCDFCT
jgi:hypothetical protein